MCPTHQLIDRQAYLRLQQDPAMPGSNFLALDQIMAHEGVVGEMSATLDFDGHGPGPDSPGASPYSYHYYNPLTDRGGAPGAASQFYFDLLNPAGRDRAKGAAWAAHFIADMSVPYHIVGMPRDDAFEYAGANRNLIDVRETGPLILYDNSREGALIPPEGWGGFGNFADALRLYVTKLSENEADWFDPWYANGTGYHNSQKVAFSSHVLWENGAYHGYRGWSAVSKSGDQHVKTSVTTSHDANCPVTRVVDNSRPDDYLVILPHGSGNAPDVPWLLERVSP